MEKDKKAKKPGIFTLLKPYKGLISLLVLFALLSNGINLLLPKLIARGIDTYTKGSFNSNEIALHFGIAIGLIFIFTYLQSIVQTYASERVARDLRSRLAHQISRQSHAMVESLNPSKLLTNLTADADSIKLFVSQAIVSITSSIFLIVGASILLLNINWKLGLCIITIIPIIGITFYLVLKKVKVLFVQSREVIDWLNKVINESILGSAIIRVINSQQLEYDKFITANAKARNLGLAILKLFAGLIPVIIFISNLAGLTILALGGHFVITGSMSLGEFAAFNSYLSILIFPILVIGFMSNVMAQATASYQRIASVLDSPELLDEGELSEMTGNMTVENISLNFGQKPALKDISFTLRAGSKTAIIGPTAAGKTQLLYLLTGLTKPSHGLILFDGHDLQNYNQDAFYSQLGFVFQDSIIFNMSIRENIAFSKAATDQSLEKAIETAELKDFIAGLPEGLDTMVSERGSSLSGGQKQRIMLARALAIEPKILLLDDFTARVDYHTEQRILENIHTNYPGITLLSVTQKISAIEQYNHIIVLMQGEIIAQGTHQELMSSSTEYVQIHASQQSTSNYELQS
ncbi:ABC transporter ATP-binding protein/permease [Pedobacter sp. MC2016-14]|uniref:ABC transporter ATP-binding protein n=1 Tax=Pedobacter sp. MC2016-14 TaxID=2897327 RepID=UPI001E504C70|nr:ABC transporter ATP-binding protein [Pedobacter sp. MC2016-14]MCD0488989.1 ABC transporter ATP-binding protein/permease [Pedobacter sp. MC2016-14]